MLAPPYRENPSNTFPPAVIHLHAHSHAETNHHAATHQCDTMHEKMDHPTRNGPPTQKWTTHAKRTAQIGAAYLKYCGPRGLPRGVSGENDDDAVPVEPSEDLNEKVSEFRGPSEGPSEGGKGRLVVEHRIGSHPRHDWFVPECSQHSHRMHRCRCKFKRIRTLI